MAQSLSRAEIADLWCQCARIRRVDIFGPADPLRPKQPKGHPLADEVDVPSVGMVGPNYRAGGRVMLSVNGAGGKADSRQLPSSARMYYDLRQLRDASLGPSALRAFEQHNQATIDSIPDWGVAKDHINKLLQAMQVRLTDIAYLYLVPFRTDGDNGSAMPVPFTEASYQRHLQGQLRLLRPGLIVAIDRPSERAARQYAGEDPSCKVFYYTRKRDAHKERARLLQELEAVASRHSRN